MGYVFGRRFELGSIWVTSSCGIRFLFANTHVGPFWFFGSRGVVLWHLVHFSHSLLGNTFFGGECGDEGGADVCELLEEVMIYKESLGRAGGWTKLEENCGFR